MCFDVKDIEYQGRKYPKQESYRKKKCVNCGQEEQAMNEINGEGICQKCEVRKEALERYGSTTRIRRRNVCKVETDCYDSRARGEIVCSDRCNRVLTIVNKVYQDKLQKERKLIIREKVWNVVNQLNKMMILILMNGKRSMKSYLGTLKST